MRDYTVQMRRLLVAMGLLTVPTAVSCGDRADSSGKTDTVAPRDEISTELDADSGAPPDGTTELVDVVAPDTGSDGFIPDVGVQPWSDSWGGVEGRPLMVGGVARVAQQVARSPWSAATGSSETDAPAAHRAAIAASWRKSALAEHASVASFFRFGLELLQLGAPPSLISGAAKAAMDEVRHAMIACELATSLDGGAAGPGALDCHDVHPHTDWPTIAAACVHEGCVGETIAAAQLECAAAAAPAHFAAILRGIADDEDQHSSLAWAFVAWSWRAGGTEVRAAVAHAFEEVITKADAAVDANEAILSDVPNSLRRKYGRLARGEAARLASETLERVIAPCARALMADANANVGTAHLM